MNERGTRVLERAWPGYPATWRDARERLTPVLVNLLRMTVGGVLAYGFTTLLTNGPIDLTGALTALLVMQASVAGSFRMGVVRVGAVLTGVGTALLVSIWFGLSWWSLGIVIFTALLLAKVFRLGDQALETPISAMLILGASGQEIAAEVRVLTTLIGTAVGILLPLLWPPAIPIPSAAGAVRRVAAGLADAFRQASESVDEHPLSRASIDERIDRVRQVTGEIGRASDQIGKLRDAWRWNTRALGRANVAPLLQSGLETLQGCALATQALFYVVRREAPDDETTDTLGPEVRAAFAVVLGDVGRCIDAYGQVLEAETRGREAEVETRLAESTFLLAETRSILTELMLTGPADEKLWILRGSILRAVDEILLTLDPQKRADSRAEWRVTQGDRPLPSTATTEEIASPIDTAFISLIRRGMSDDPPNPIPSAAEQGPKNA